MCRRPEDDRRRHLRRERNRRSASVSATRSYLSGKDGAAVLDLTKFPRPQTAAQDVGRDCRAQVPLSLADVGVWVAEGWSSMDAVDPGLAYQVAFGVGRSMAPAVVRYLVGTSTVSELPNGDGLSGVSLWSSAATLAQLGLGLANLGVGLTVLTEVRELGRRLDEIALGLEASRAALDEVARKVDRIAVDVAEQNLRSGIRHQLSASIGPDSVDLAGLSSISRDIEKFAEAINGLYIGAAPNLRLSSDTRELLQACHRLYSTARGAALARHNLDVGGHPERVKVDAESYVDLGAAIFGAVQLLRVCAYLVDAGRALGDHVFNQFTFASEADKQGYNSFVSDEILSNVVALTYESNFVGAGACRCRWTILF